MCGHLSSGSFPPSLPPYLVSVRVSDDGRDFRVDHLGVLGEGREGGREEGRKGGREG